MNKYWIVVASQDHCMRGVEQGFIQTCHGKLTPLKKMKFQDKIILYAPKLQFGKKDLCQKFISVGTVLEGEPYQVVMYEDFHPYRINVLFDKKLEPIPILPLIQDLDFITNKKYWSAKFRFGYLEITFKDYNLIYSNFIDKKL